MTMTEPAPAATLTPAEHRAAAESSLNLIRAGGYPPSTATYQNLTLSAIAHVLTAIACYLEPPVPPQVPGLPAGWEISTRQSTAGDQLWGYLLTGPAGRGFPSRFQWGSSETALTAGIKAAQALSRQQHQNGG